MLGEAAGALAGFTDDPAALVTACRRLVDRQPTYGPMWWLAAHVLNAADPDHVAWETARDFDRDPTPSFVAEELPAGATITVIDWPEQTSLALRRRGDLIVLVVGGDYRQTARAFESYDVNGEVVSATSAGAAIATSDIVVLETRAAGPDAFLADHGSLAAALVARHYGKPVWLIAGRGRVLPSRMWDALCARQQQSEDQAWELDEEVVPLTLIDVVATPDGVGPAPRTLATDCPIAPELLREVG